MDWGEVSGDQLDEALAHFSGLTAAGQARLCEVIVEVDSRQGWMRDGAKSLAEWVSARLSMRFENAARLVRIARRIADLPLVSERFAAGELSLDQVDALSRLATPSNEESLIQEVLGLDNSQLDRLARRANPPTAEDERTVWERRRLVRQWSLDESELRFHGTLPGAEGALFDQAISDRVDSVPPDPSTGLLAPLETRAADALIEMSATSGDLTSPPQITVNADLESLTSETEGATELTTGALVPNDVARYLACDCVVESVVTDGSQVIGIGRNSRTVPGWLRRLVLHRDGYRCRFPGCRNTKWLQIHHIVHWAHGGATDLDNLVTLCGHHHRFLHTEEWHVTRSDGDRLVFRKPDWSPYPKPRPPLHPRLAALTRPS